MAGADGLWETTQQQFLAVSCRQYQNRKEMKMKNKAVFFLTFIVWAQCTFGQASKIIKVENNLTEARDLIFEDSIVLKFNILNRMENFH